MAPLSGPRPFSQASSKAGTGDRYLACRRMGLQLTAEFQIGAAVLREAARRVRRAYTGFDAEPPLEGNRVDAAMDQVGWTRSTASDSLLQCDAPPSRGSRRPPCTAMPSPNRWEHPSRADVARPSQRGTTCCTTARCTPSADRRRKAKVLAYTRPSSCDNTDLGAS